MIRKELLKVVKEDFLSFKITLISNQAFCGKVFMNLTLIKKMAHQIVNFSYTDNFNMKFVFRDFAVC